MPRTTILVLFVLFSACSSEPMRFRRDGATSKDLKHDWIDCKTKFGMSRMNPGSGKKFMQDCMEGQGWTRLD